MNLTELGLNRFLYKSSTQNTADSSLLSSSSSSGDNFSATSLANGIASGTIVTSCILQSSPSDNRIQISPDDTLRAYNNGQVILQIDRNGLALAGDQYFVFDGVKQPITYTGYMSTGGVLSNGPVGWSGLFLLVGFYRVVHNLNLTSPYLRVQIQGDNSSFIVTTINSTANYFDIAVQNSSGTPTTADFEFVAFRYLP